jgi:hypothetical protein
MRKANPSGPPAVATAAAFLCFAFTIAQKSADLLGRSPWPAILRRVINLFNHVNFNTPNPVVYAAAIGDPSPTAGVVTSTATSSRQVQFGLKLLW